MIRKEKHDYDGRLGLIEGSKAWRWVSELYPSIYTHKRKVFFMSADKFVMRNDTIIGKSNTIYDSPIVKDAVIFIDEFDSTRNQILSRLIQNSGRRRIDLVDMILKIHGGLSGDDLPSKVFIQHGTIRGDLKKDNEFVEKCFKKTIGKHHLDKIIKADADYQKGKAFIFTSETKYMVSDVNDSVVLEFRKDENRNILRFFNGDRKLNSKLFYTLDDVDYCIDKFCRYISKMAVNYQRNERDQTLSYEDCVLTILDVHGIGDGTPSYRGSLLERILLGTSSSENRIEGVDGSVYTNGFGYYVMRDESSNNERTAIELLSYPVSAERILLKVCEQALVFGMSATAGLRTVLGNYDLDYIRSRLGDRFLPPVEGDERMAEQIFASRSGYDRDRIRVAAVSSRGDCGYSDGLWAEVIPEELMGTVADRLDIVDDDYDKERYLQVCKAFAAFLDDPDAHAGLCFCNKHPADGDRAFDRSMLKLLLSAIIAGKGDRVPDDFRYESSVFYLKGDGYDTNKKTILEHLASGRKGFVVTTYNTVGAGQNLQFGIPNGAEALNVSDYEDSGEMDFDFIYLQKPTHLVSVPEFPEDEEAKAMAISQISYLLQNGEITEKEAKDGISAVLSFDIEGMRAVSGIARQSRSAKRFATGRVIQAVGRICRTNMKNVRTTILYDEGLSELIDEPLEDYGVVNVETEQLIMQVSAGVKASRDEQSFADMGVHRSHNAARVIDELKSAWTEDHIRDYTLLREDILRNPSADVLNNTVYQMYMEVPAPTDHYFVRYKGEFKDLRISFDGRMPGCHEVSARSVRLPEILSVPGMREHFERNGYATDISPGRYIITPVAAKNLWMGMLGEVAGRFILERHGIRIEDLDRKYFERFDCQISPDVAIDFKHWSSERFTSKEEQIAKIVGKMNDSKHGTVYVINVLLPEGKSRDCIREKRDGRTIVTVPWLYDPATGDTNMDIISELRGIKK